MRRVFTINRSTTKMPRECTAVGCTELQIKGSLFSFHTFPKDSSRKKLHPWRFELEIVPSRLPCGHPHRHDFFYYRVSVTHRPAFARLILNRWKERSLRMKYILINENNREKSKSLKVNRNSAGLCTNE